VEQPGWDTTNGLLYIVSLEGDLTHGTVNIPKSSNAYFSQPALDG
jgi:hypothetical protein